MAAAPDAPAWRTGDVVEWGRGTPQKATLIARAVDEDDGTPLLCSDDDCRRPLWRLRFADGVVKSYACEGAIRGKLPG